MKLKSEKVDCVQDNLECSSFPAMKRNEMYGDVLNGVTIKETLLQCNLVCGILKREFYSVFSLY